MQLAPLRLKKNHDRRLRFGHCWIYSNEVDTQATPLQGLEAGQPAEFLNHQGKWIGSGYINPHSLICGRLVSRDREHPLSGSLIVHRLRIALALRKRLYPLPYYRLVFGESDGLPGLVIDRYGDLVVLQITTAGMERLLDEIVRAVEKVLRPVGVILRNDTEVRKAEGLESRVEMVSGVLPDALEVEEGGLRFRVPATSGQKTGWFFDQAFNRERMRRYLPAERVLDVCSYLGSWALQAAAQGAEQVLCIVRGGQDLMTCLQTYIPRITHLHLKDATANGEWVALGEGGCDFPAVMALLESVDYAGWIVAEEESAEARQDGLAAIRKNRAYLQTLGY